MQLKEDWQKSVNSNGIKYFINAEDKTNWHHDKTDKNTILKFYTLLFLKALNHVNVTQY